MASTKQVKIGYSSRLDSMAEYIRRYAAKDSNEERIAVQNALAIFCYNNTQQFINEFLKRAGIDVLGQAISGKTDESEIDKFVDELINKDGECLFLLKDTYQIMRKYQSNAKKGYGLLVNRHFLCWDNNEEDYFTLIQPIYDCLILSHTLDDFLKRYRQQIELLIQNHDHFNAKSKEIYNYVSSHSKGPVVWVDIGFQFTFVLFCMASIDYWSKGKAKQDFYCYTCYPWLQELFAGKYFSSHFESALAYEISGMEQFSRSLTERASGSLAGFAIGDALGFPVAGIDASDIPKFISVPVRGFIDNPSHPYFSHLKAGNFTDNTIMLKLSAQSMIKHKGLNIEAHAQELADWGKEIFTGKKQERWAGPTAFTAINRLVDGTSYRESGSTTTESCSSTYRVIPLGIHYYAFNNLSSGELAEKAQIVGGITHNSEISRTGATLVALTIADLMVGVIPNAAVNSAIQLIGLTQGNERLIKAVLEAVRWSETASDEEARKHFGTGSPIYQTLPLAIFYFLKYQSNFRYALLAAANSFRDDTPEETERIKGLSWEEQLIAAKGGNTDGIGGLVGAFIGAHLGMSAIPSDFKQVEEFDVLTKLGEKLVG